MLRLPIPDGYTLEEFKKLDRHKQWSLRHPQQHLEKERARGRTDAKKKQRNESKRKVALNDVDQFIYNRWVKYLKSQYNLSVGDYWNLFEQQGGVCAMCFKPESVVRTLKVYGQTAYTKRLCVDHDHSCCKGAKSCGKCIRGLLCHHCNTTLGSARDSINTLKNGINYLSKWRRL